MKKRTPRISSSFYPQKRLGQHFLKDQHVVQRIIQLGRFDQADRVIEIGPGLGALTLPLAEVAGRVVAVEKDNELYQALNKKLSRKNIKNVELINEDILRFDPWQQKEFEHNKVKVIGNLPYNISSPLLEKLVEHRDRIETAILMFQYEFARRLTASPGSKAYGSLTVLTQYHARLSPLLQVGREAFYPRPGVDSMVIEIDFQKPYARRAEDELLFEKTVRQAFLHKRKTLLNSLSGAGLPLAKEDLRSILLKTGLDPKRRAETLSIDEFLQLAVALSTST